MLLLNMTAAPQMRDLAHRLLTHEAAAGKTPESMESPTLRVYEKLRQSIGVFVGVAGFQSLATRALILARPEAPSLCAAQISADGALQGLGRGPDENESPFEIEKNQPVDEGIILIARLLGLLRLLIGEAITLSLLRNAWPGEVFDDRTQRTGEKREHSKQSEDQQTPHWRSGP